MNSKQNSILEAIYRKPVPMNLTFRDIEKFLISVGCEIIEGAGARIGFKKNRIRLDMHKPHPNKEIKAYQVKAVRDFLNELGIRP